MSYDEATDIKWIPNLFSKTQLVIFTFSCSWGSIFWAKTMLRRGDLDWMTYFQVEQAVHWSGSATAERCGKVEDAQWPIHPVFQFPTSSLWWWLTIRLIVMGQAMCLTDIFLSHTITHEKLTTGICFRGGGCRATDSSCSRENCHCPHAPPPPPRRGCWQVVVLS